MCFYSVIKKVWQIMGRMNDYIFRGGGDFSTWVSREEMGISDTEGNQYQPSSDLLFFVLKKLKPCNKDSIIDIGCGKGRAMWIMSKFAFGKIHGFDISKELVEVANNNFLMLNLANCCAEYGDAADYDAYDDYNYFYVSNPVPKPIFEKMLKHIEISLVRTPRKALLIYMNPIYNDSIVQNKSFKLLFSQKHIIKWFRFNVYIYEV